MNQEENPRICDRCGSTCPHTDFFSIEHICQRFIRDFDDEPSEWEMSEEAPGHWRPAQASGTAFELGVWSNPTTTRHTHRSALPMPKPSTAVDVRCLLVVAPRNNR